MLYRDVYLRDQAAAAIFEASLGPVGQPERASLVFSLEAPNSVTFPYGETLNFKSLESILGFDIGLSELNDPHLRPSLDRVVHFEIAGRLPASLGEHMQEFIVAIRAMPSDVQSLTLHHARWLSTLR